MDSLILDCARYAPIDYTNVPKLVRLDILCIHTAVSSRPASAAHVSNPADGKMIQHRDLMYQSAANLFGNPRIAAVENMDRGEPFPDWNINDGHAVPPMTDEQCESLAVLAAELHRKRGLVLELAPNSLPGSKGIAYHRMGCDGNFAGYAYGGRVAGGELWSRSFGKVCPGDARIEQVIEIVIPRARVLAGLDKPAVIVPPVIEEDEYMERIIVVWGKRPTDGPGYASLCGVVMPGRQAGDRVFLDITGRSNDRASVDLNTKMTGAGRWDSVTYSADVWETYRASFQTA